MFVLLIFVLEMNFQRSICFKENTVTSEIYLRLHYPSMGTDISLLPAVNTFPLVAAHKNVGRSCSWVVKQLAYGGISINSEFAGHDNWIVAVLYSEGVTKEVHSLPSQHSEQLVCTSLHVSPVLHSCHFSTRRKELNGNWQNVLWATQRGLLRSIGHRTF